MIVVVQKRRRISLRPWLRVAATLTLLGLLLLLLGPALAIEAQRPGADKVGHVGAFAIMFGAVAILFDRLPPWGVALLTIAVGAATEVAQGYVGRDPDPLDMVANIIGIGIGLAGVLTAQAACRWRSRRDADAAF